MKQTITMEVRGTRGKGRQRTRWMENIRHEPVWFGGGILPRQDNMEKDGTEPRPGIIGEELSRRSYIYV